MKIGAVITAAGLSSRMGDFKPLLPYRNTTMIRYVISLMKNAGADPVVVVTGYRGEELREHVKDMDVVIAENGEYACTQMFDSVCLGLAALGENCDRAAFMPVDVPDISPELVRKIFGTEGQIVRPVYHGRPGHPVVLDGALIKRICSYRGERGLRGAMEALDAKICEVEAKDDGIYNDIDTAEDYRKLLQKEHPEEKGTGERLLYLVRHGAVEFPPGEKRCIGRTDLPLSEEGRKQADRLKDYFRDRNIEKVYSSPLIRAVETARRLAPENGEIQTEECFSEIFMGDWENRPLKSLNKKLEDEAPNGELRADALKRFTEGVEQVLKETEGNAVIVSHAGILCAYLSRRLNLPLETSRSIRQPYCGITILAVRKGSSPRVLEYGVRGERAPEEEEIQRLYEKCGTPENVIRHCRAVAREAVSLGRELNRRGYHLDEKLIRAAGLLHDVLRMEKGHSARGYELLLREGYPEVGDIVLRHDRLDRERLDETALVFYADKRYIDEKYVTLEERFRRSGMKTAGNPEAEKARAERYGQAVRIEKLIEKALNRNESVRA